MMFTENLRPSAIICASLKGVQVKEEAGKLPLVARSAVARSHSVQRTIYSVVPFRRGGTVKTDASGVRLAFDAETVNSSWIADCVQCFYEPYAVDTTRCSVRCREACADGTLVGGSLSPAGRSSLA